MLNKVKYWILGVLTVLAFTSGLAYAATWLLPPVIHKGDLIVGGSDTQAIRLPTGSPGSVLYIDPITKIPKYTATSTLGIIGGGGSSATTTINSLNGPTFTIASGTAGSIFNIQNSGTTISLNLPLASASNTGQLQAADWTTFNNKVGTSRQVLTTAPITGGGDLSVDRTIGCNVASGSQAGCLASADWTTFNNKQNALTLPLSVANGGTGSSSLNTTLVPEGNNLYFTNARAQNALTLTTTGTSGVSTYSGGTLNIPNYTSSGGGATTTINSATGPNFTFATTTDTNLGLSILTSGSTATFTPTWIGTLADGRIASAATWNAKQNAIVGGTNINISGGNTINLNNSVSLSGTLAVTGTSTLATTTIPALSNLTSNGFIKTSGGNGLLSIDTNTYLTGNQTITLSGAVTGSGATAITTSFQPGAFATGTAGNIFNIATTSSTLTLNLPIASASNTGQLSSTDWSTFNNKQNTLTNPITGTGTKDYLSRWLTSSTQGTGVSIDNGTVAGVNATSSTVNFNVQGTGTNDPFNVSSSSGTSVLRVTSGGRVGVGTSTPGAELDVATTGVLAGIRVSGGTNPLIRLDGSTVSVKLQAVDSGSIGAFGTENNYPMTVLTNNIERFRIDTAGLITQTATGQALYTLSGTFGQLYNSTGDFYITNSDATSNLILRTNSTEKLRIQANGNVGIGTTTPVAKLQVFPNANSTVGFILQGDNNQSSDVQQWQTSGGTLLEKIDSKGVLSFQLDGAGVIVDAANNYRTGFMKYPGQYGAFVHNTSSPFTIFGNSNADIRTAGTLRTDLIIDSTGNVGIGLASPLSKLHVAAGAVQIGASASAVNYATRENSLIFNRGDLPSQYLNEISSSFSGATTDTTMNFELANGASTHTTVMTLNGAGNVGIGTTTPGYTLTVAGTSLHTGNALFSGNVGIGTTTPGNALTVIGGISSSNLTSGNCVQAGAGGLLTTTGTACGSGGGGITSLNGLSGSSQTFATSTTATGLTQTITSSGTTHTWNLSLTSGYNIPLTASTTQWSGITNRFTKNFYTVGAADADYKTTGTNDNVPIQAAMDACTAGGGGIVHIKAGTYYLGSGSTNFVKAKSNCWMQGEGQNNTFIVMGVTGTNEYSDNSTSVGGISTSATSGPSATTTTTTNVNITISDLTVKSQNNEYGITLFNGNNLSVMRTEEYSSATSSLVKAGIYIRYAQRARVEDNYVHDTGGNGININAVTDFWVLNNRVFDTADDGIDMDYDYGDTNKVHCSYGLVTDNIVRTIVVLAQGNAIRVENCDYVTVSHNQVANYTPNGILVDNDFRAGGDTTTNISILDNTIASSTSVGIYTQNTSNVTSTMASILIANNHLFNNGANAGADVRGGIVISASTSPGSWQVVSNNDIDGVKKTTDSGGIEVYKADWVKITDNKVANAPYAFHLWNGSNNVTYNHIIFSGNSATSSVADYFNDNNAMTQAGVKTQSYTDTGNFGIDTSNPASTLTVQGTGSTNPFTIASSSGATIMNILPSGFIGMAQTTPTEILSVTGNISMTSGTSATNTVQGQIKFSAPDHTTAWAGIGGTTNGSGTDQMDLLFYTGFGSASEKMRLMSNTGRLGLGTTTPEADLQIADTSTSATSTMEFGSAVSTVGDCIKMHSPNHSTFYLTITNAGALQVSATSCKSGF